MQIEIPIFRQIKRDGKIPPRAFQVWDVAIEFLDLVEPRELKLSSIEHAMDIDTSTVSRALATLVERGYLYRIEMGAGLAPMYRVPLSRVVLEGASVASIEPVAAMPSHEGNQRRTRPRVLSRGVV